MNDAALNAARSLFFEIGNQNLVDCEINQLSVGVSKVNDLPAQLIVTMANKVNGIKIPDSWEGYEVIVEYIGKIKPA